MDGTICQPTHLVDWILMAYTSKVRISQIVVCCVIATMLLLPLALIALFSFSIIPWNPNADGMLQYYGTIAAAGATTYLAYRANDQNRRLIRLEEENGKSVPGVRLLHVIAFRREKSGSYVFDEALKGSYPDACNSSVLNRQIDLTERSEAESRYTVLFLEIHNYGNSPVVHLLVKLVSEKLNSERSDCVDATVLPGCSDILRIKIPRDLLESKPVFHFEFCSLAGLSTFADAEIVFSRIRTYSDGKVEHNYDISYTLIH